TDIKKKTKWLVYVQVTDIKKRKNKGNFKISRRRKGSRRGSKSTVAAFFDQPQPPQDFVDSQGILQALNKMQKELEEMKQDRRKKEDMSIEEMRHEQQLVDYEIKDITNDLGYKRFRRLKTIDE
ncbi:hypothetical protein Tco_1237570, partial [Tanacetum coccineum]